jgi:hypothetical protein
VGYPVYWQVAVDQSWLNIQLLSIHLPYLTAKKIRRKETRRLFNFLYVR